MHGHAVLCAEVDGVLLGRELVVGVDFGVSKYGLLKQ